MSKQLHEGHRDRMRDRVLQNGIDSLQSHEMLEYLLYPFIPRKDTNEIAHRLIDEFGSFSALLNADAHRIQSVKGVTHNAAVFLASLPDVFRRYLGENSQQRTSLSGRGAARNFIGSMLYGVPEERVIAVALDAHDGILKCDVIATGSGDTVILSVRDIVNFALKYMASGMIIAHNHPSGSTSPSPQDFALTRELLWTLDSVNVKLLDHYIFCLDEYYSFEEEGKLRMMREEKSASLKEGILFYE